MTITTRHAMRWAGLALIAGFALLIGTGVPTNAQAPSNPVVGSANTVTADRAVPRPTTVPVKVPLFSNFKFNNFNLQDFQYTPPGDGHAKWAKVIFVADFSVNAGIQFDRTGQVSIGNVNVYFGTTAEPSPSVGPSWHVERDITDYSALLRAPQTGVANLGNIVNSTYTGVITGSAYLLFYPENQANPAPATPDMVLPIPNSAGGAQGLASSSDLLSETFTFPTNVTRAYLDLITQSQIGDEFWYLGVPNDIAGELETFGGTAFREAEVSVDGMPAGVAPVYPWIYTGGLDPYLWTPIPGVQTLNFVPYRVDLTPFAALFSNGKPHTVAVQLYNSNNYFNVLGTLLLYRDPVLKTVTGGLTADTLPAEPAPQVTANLTTTTSGVSGPVTDTSDRQFTIAGYVNTSSGVVKTQVMQSVDFSSVQNFDITATDELQDVQQSTTVLSDTKTTIGTALNEVQESFSYPLVIDYNFPENADGSFSQIVSISQGYQVKRSTLQNGTTTFAGILNDAVQTADTLQLDSNFNLTGHSGQKSASTYTYSDSTEANYSRSLASANGAITSVKTSGK